MCETPLTGEAGSSRSGYQPWTIPTDFRVIVHDFSNFNTIIQ